MPTEIAEMNNTSASSSPSSSSSSFCCSSMTSNGVDRFPFLLEKLEQIQSKKCLPKNIVEDAMHDFACSLLHLRQEHDMDGRNINVVVFPRGDENLLNDLATHFSAVQILLHALENPTDNSPQFYNSACIALVHFAFKSPRRAKLIYDHGGLTSLEAIMQQYRSVDFLQITCIAALMVLARNAAKQYQLETGENDIDMVLQSMTRRIVEHIIHAMEYHESSSEVYIVACSALDNVYGSHHRSSYSYFSSRSMGRRVLKRICCGIILHPYNRVAQDVGNNLLRCMVGNEAARQMIAQAELQYGTVVCAAAAAA